MRPDWGECIRCGERFKKVVWNKERCDSCRDSYRKEWSRRPEVQERQRRNWRAWYARGGYAAHIARKYGVTIEWFSERSANGCEVCGTRERLVVDHDHETGDARGVLCNWCNVSIGNARDDPERLRKLAVYLER